MSNTFTIEVTIITKSNCLIGNQTESFSVGGVDQSTTVDENGRSIIHGSAFKGSFRNIIRENDDNINYMKYTKDYLRQALDSITKKYEGIPDEKKTEKIKNMIEKIEGYKSDMKAEYIFGIEGINNMPRLFFSDFRVTDNTKEINSYFNIETKNSLEEKNGNIESRPRTYRVVKPNIDFKGTIRFNDTYFKGKKVNLSEIKNELENELKKFNKGFYGIGNSKSRGYGKIEVK